MGSPTSLRHEAASCTDGRRTHEDQEAAGQCMPCNLRRGCSKRAGSIEFTPDNVDNRKVMEITVYEVKTKTDTNTSRFELCMSSYETYASLQKMGVKTFLVAFVLCEDCRYAWNIMICIWQSSGNTLQEARITKKRKEKGSTPC